MKNAAVFGATIVCLFLLVYNPIIAQTLLLPSFTLSEHELGRMDTQSIALGDLDGDGDLDIFAANIDANQVWLNDGLGNFTNSGQNYGAAISRDVALADVDGDGDLDALVANSEANRIWLNNGQAIFTDGQAIGSDYTPALAVGDFDGDGDMDAYFGNRSFWIGRSDEVWLNDGTGYFTNTNQQLGNETSSDTLLGDADGDGDLDVFVISCGAYDEPNRLWLNDGTGMFTDSGQDFDGRCEAALGVQDIDRDSDLDVVIGSAGSNQGSFHIWTNDGSGSFSLANTITDDANHLDLSLSDLDNDGDPDLILNIGTIWLNTNAGNFVKVPQQLNEARGLAVGDINGDNRPDIIQNRDGPNRIWIGHITSLDRHTHMPMISR